MTEPLNAYVGRQAVFDRRLQVVGYELLYRNSDENRARFSDADKATAETMLNAFVELGLDLLAPNVPVWVNLPEAFLLGRYPIPLPPERTVIEVLEDVPVTPDLLTSLARFHAEGFKIALDDFVLTDETRPLLDHAWAIKVDVLNVPREEIARQFAELKPTGAVMVAEKISTHDEHTFLRDLGFYYFQGHFLEMPIISKTQRLPHDRAMLVKILSALYSAKLDLREIETLIAAEAVQARELGRILARPTDRLGAPSGVAPRRATGRGADHPRDGRRL
jgi:c-di-GMP phosphodiesterase